MQLCTVTLTGTKMSQISRVNPEDLLPGRHVSIHRRPDNAYDPQAMSVHSDFSITSPQVGWIPAKEIEDKTRKEVLFNLAALPGIVLWGIVEQFEPETKFLRIQVHFDIEDEDDDEGGM